MRTSDRQSDPDLIAIQKTIGGDPSQFALLICKYKPLLFKIAKSYCHYHEDAEDIVQEAHYSAWLQLHNFRRESSYKTWITKILINKCYHHIQDRRKKFQYINIDLLNDVSASVENYYDGQKSAVNNELKKLLEQSLENLPLLYRTVFVLRKVQGFSILETADMLNITPVNVKIRLTRARALLRSYLEQYYSPTDLYDFHPIQQTAYASCSKFYLSAST